MQRESYIREIRQKRALDLAVHLRMYNVFPGLRQTKEVGWGFDIFDIRDFEPGDDPMDIDIDGLRQGEPNVIEHQSVEEVPIMLFVDTSPSLAYYLESPEHSKALIRDIAAGLLIFSSLKTMGSIGLVLFSNEIERIFYPEAGEYANYLFDNLLAHEGSDGAGTSLSAAARCARRFPENIVCLISDFQDREIQKDEMKWHSILVGLDVVPIVIRDPLEKMDFGDGAYFFCCDPESGEKFPVYMTQGRYQKIREESERFYRELYRGFERFNIPYVSLDSPDVDECNKRLQQFFAKKLATLR